MRNTIYTGKKLAKATALCLAVLLMPLWLFAQKVNVSTAIFPPYSPYYSDYSGSNASKVLLVLQNNTGEQLNIKLTGKLEGDNGIRITTRANYVPLQPIVLNPREVKQLNGLALKDIFSIDNLNVYGISKTTLAQTSRIPEGNYNFCVTAVDYSSSEILSAQAPLGCTILNIVYPEPPVLMNPMPQAHVRATKIQNVTFNWVNPGTVPVGTQYQLIVAEMPDNIKDPNQVLNSVTFPTLRRNLPSSTYVYNARDLGLKPGKRYAWRVVSSDPTGRTTFRNKGASPGAMFYYDPEDKPDLAIEGNMKLAVRKYEVSGHLTYQYHQDIKEVQFASFPGRKLDTVPLRYADVQLCYGIFLVKMDIKPKAYSTINKNGSKNTNGPASSIQSGAIPKSANAPGALTDKAAMSVKNGQVKTLAQTQALPDSIPMDSIPTIGQPIGINVAGNSQNGLGEVLATAKTDTNGYYKFNFTTMRPCKILQEMGDNRALVYGYYVNIKDKHYTDPTKYVYINLPEEDEVGTGAMGDVGVFVKNYNLTVNIDRNKEAGSNTGAQQNASVENKDGGVANLYILTEYGPKSTIRPYDDGDNLARPAFKPAADAQKYFGSKNFYVVTKREITLSKDKDLGLFDKYSGQYVLQNMVDNPLGENYWVYVEYKSSKVMFEPVQIALPLESQEEFTPVLAQKIRSHKVDLKPAYVSIIVKGVLKYQFKNGTAKPLANTQITLESVWYDINNKEKDPAKQHVYDLDNKQGNNELYSTVTTDANGYFELNAGQMQYDKYHSASNFLFGGWNQFVRVQSPYYGSPDKAYQLEAGNTYNVGELVANVKEHGMVLTVRGQNLATNKEESLPGQRVFLCRKKDANTAAWGVPKDEGEQNALPLKTINDKDGVPYKVISYGMTDETGTARFKHMVVRDPLNASDVYYLYSESGILSTLNYSSEYGKKIEMAGTMAVHKAIDKFPVLNSTLDNDPIGIARTLISYPQKPVIDGGVYPFSNTSTNAMSGVNVRLFDMTKYSKTQFEDYVKNTDPETVIYNLVMWGAAQVQAYQTTQDNGLFLFDNELTDNYKGWKLLTYSKAGFISGYTIINSGNPLTKGMKQNVKGFLMPPRKLKVSIKDGDTGEPIKCKIVVGDNFSWAATKSIKKDFTPGDPVQGVTVAEVAELQSTYGSVKFTVLPEDNVNYKPVEFTRIIAAPKKDANGIPQMDNSVEDLGVINIYMPYAQASVYLKDANTGTQLPGLVYVTQLPQNETPPVGIATAKKGAEFKFRTNSPQYGVRATSPGYVTQEINVKVAGANSMSLVTIQMEKGLTLSGTVTVDGKPVYNAKVYIKELAGQYPDVTTNAQGFYSMKGVPITYNTVTMAAVAPDKNAVGSTQQVVLAHPPAKNGQKPVDEKTVNFALTSNMIFDVSKLYGFPLEVESLAKNGDGYLLNGRVKMPMNNTLRPMESSYLTLKNVAVAAPQAKSSQPKGNSNSGQISVNTDVLTPQMQTIKPTGKVLSQEHYIEAQVFNKYYVDIYGPQGVELQAKNSAQTQGSVYASLLMPSDGVTKAVEWEGNVMLVPVSVGSDAVEKGKSTSPSFGDVMPSDKEVQAAMGINPTTMSVGYSTNTNKKTTTVDAKAGGDKQVSADGLGLGANVGQYNNDANKPKTANNSSQTPGANMEAPFDIMYSAGGAAQFSKLQFKKRYGGDFIYKLNNIYNVEARPFSSIDAAGLHLFSTIHTNLQNVAEPDLYINAGEVLVTDKPLSTIIGSTDLNIPLDDWNLKGKWYLQKGNIKLTGNLFAGTLTLPVSGLEVSETSLGFGDIQVTNIGLAGVYKMNINPAETMTSFGFDKAAKYGTLYNQAYGAWSLSLLPKDPKKPLTQLAHLKDLAENDLVNIMNISLYSKGGESRVMLMQDHPTLTLNGFASFKPYEAENTKDFFKLNGSLDLNIPAITGLSDKTYSVMYAAEGNQLAHKHQNLPALNMVSNGVRVEFYDKWQSFVNGKLMLNGIVRDKVAASPYNLAVRLTKYAPGSQSIMVRDSAINVVDMGKNLQTNKPQQMVAIKGGMIGTELAWDNFHFEGDIVGADGMREEAAEKAKKTHMAFEVKGDLVANNAEIGVKNLSLGAADNFNITYDFEKQAIVGSFHVLEKTENATFDTDFEFQLGSGQWYLLGSAKISDIKNTPVPVNGAAGAVCVGSCTLTPDMMQIIQSKFHDGILPNDFEANFHTLHGTLLVTAVDLNLPLIPDINLNLGPIAHVTVEKGIYANAYLGLQFEEKPNVIGGIKVGVYVKVSAGASVLVGCAGLKLGAEVNAAVNTKIILPPYGEFIKFQSPDQLVEKSDITMGAEANVILTGEAYYGWGVCDDDCSSIKVWGVKIPPGCHKSGIGKGMTLTFGAKVQKPEGTLTPTRGEVYVKLFDEPHTAQINIPGFSFKQL
ncbi:hypothetical protein [Mucilaginibacter pedocola]|uniref:Fibronectin type-III domain-containing protein n=1 Tax=Mucilaginibacter pedocola TaxID=1792845 RepID=A0A1S9PF25_9SPHI|nr:hypothetical protein [Mucilaginibacter pedocola]OOQ59547.1 hypothetical protein BC343_05090 [Mucilaginibacter pedocola]